MFGSGNLSSTGKHTCASILLPPPSDLANILKDMELLIERKLKMFPDDKRQIVSARVVKAGTNYRVEVASATLQ